MANCCICGKKIGGWGEDKLTLTQGKECCYQCAPLIRSIESAENSDIFFSRLDELNQKMRNVSTPYDIQSMLETKYQEIAENKGYTRGDDHSCLVCGLPLKKGDISCQKCGAIIDNPNYKMNISEIASIYNKRFEQYRKNAMYEYKVETVMDSAVLGKFDKDKVQQTLRDYAVNGWKLHSAFTNEVGKNAALGINATINQTVLIFERCVKAVDD